MTVLRECAIPIAGMFMLGLSAMFRFHGAWMILSIAGVTLIGYAMGALERRE